MCVCLSVCPSICLSVDEDFPGKGRGPGIPGCPGWLSKHPTTVGMSVGGGIASQSEGPAGGPGVARAGPPPLPLARVQDEALLNPADAKAFGSHVAHSSLPPRLQSDPGPDLGLPTLPLSAGQPGLPLLGLRARCQPRHPPVLSPPTVHGAGSWQAGRDCPKGLWAARHLGPSAPHIPYLWVGQPRWPVLSSLKLGSVVRVHFLPRGEGTWPEERESGPPACPDPAPGRPWPAGGPFPSLSFLAAPRPIWKVP